MAETYRKGLVPANEKPVMRDLLSALKDNHFLLSSQAAIHEKLAVEWAETRSIWREDFDLYEARRARFAHAAMAPWSVPRAIADKYLSVEQQLNEPFGFTVLER